MYYGEFYLLVMRHSLRVKGLNGVFRIKLNWVFSVLHFSFTRHLVTC